MRCFRASVVKSSVIHRLCHQWSDGNSGETWKVRDLNERREVAQEMLSSVERRKLITDAGRLRCKESLARLTRVHDKRETILQESFGHFNESETDDASLLREIENLVACEAAVESLRYVPSDDLRSLQNELIENSAHEPLNKWKQLRLRSESAFSSLPLEERSQWSAWYLRDVRSRSD